MYPQAATGGSSQAFTGSKASFVALASVTSFSIALLTSIWYSDVRQSFEKRCKA